MSEAGTPRPGGEIVVYQADDGGSRIRVLLEDETVWLTQAGLAELYQTTSQNITIHLRSIYDEGELAEEATCKESLQVRLSGPGTVSHDDALEWAHEQYDAFAERRRLEAEAEAEARYVEDLRTSAKMLETQRKKPSAPKKSKKKTKAKQKPRRRDGE